jgi:hypothetical protein
MSLNFHDKDIVLAAVKQDGRALENASERLRNDVLFFWLVWNISSEYGDDVRQQYVQDSLLTHAFELSIGLISLSLGGLILGGVIALSPASIPFMIFGGILAALGSLILGAQTYVHTFGFFNAKEVLNTEPNPIIAANMA